MSSYVLASKQDVAQLVRLAEQSIAELRVEFCEQMEDIVVKHVAKNTAWWPFNNAMVITREEASNLMSTSGGIKGMWMEDYPSSYGREVLRLCEALKQAETVSQRGTPIALSIRDIGILNDAINKNVVRTVQVRYRDYGFGPR